jgi:hypothetical protein
MRLQSQLLSEKCLDEHLDPLPFCGRKKQARKRLDVSRFHAAGLCRQPTVSKAFGFNYTLGTGTVFLLFGTLNSTSGFHANQ